MQAIKYVRFVALSVLLVAAGGSLHASPEEIERRQEEIAMAWIEAHNSGKVASMATIRDKHFKRSEIKEWQDGFRRLVDKLGQLEPYGIMVHGPGKLTIGCDSANIDERVRLTFEFHADAPEQMLQIGLDIGGDDPDGATEDIPTIDFSADWKARKQELNAYLQMLADDGLFSGTVLLANPDGVLYEGAAGLASREFNVPNDLETRFDVGSINKDYTRIGISRLAAEGKLGFDDTVGKHLPDYPNADVRAKVTIQQLLDHTSGLGDYFTEEYFKTPMSNLREIEDYLPIWGPKPLLSEPGKRERYSNYGYTVLGAIIERLSGMSYPDYVAKHVFESAGMTRSGFFETDAVVPNVAVGYTHFGPQGRLEKAVKNIYLEPAKGGPWGKSYSTARDLYRFYDSMFKGGILEGEANWLAGGWNKGSLAVAGGGPGMSACTWVEGGLMVIVLANMDEPIAEILAETLWRQLK